MVQSSNKNELAIIIPCGPSVSVVVSVVMISVVMLVSSVKENLITFVYFEHTCIAVK